MIGIKDALNAFGSRLQAVGLLPTFLAVSTVVFMFLADAPRHDLSWQVIVTVAESLGGPGLVVLTGAAVAVAISLAPLQFRLVQLLEGYWPGGQMTWFFRAGLAIQRWRLQRLEERQVIAVEPRSDAKQRALLERAGDAEQRIRERFPEPDRLLPTGLGNVLRSAEDRAGIRYGVETVTIWPRLFAVLPKDVQESIEDEVVQLDVSSRLAVTWSLTAVTGSALLALHPVAAWTHPGWLLLVASLWGLAWLSYRAAIESALAHGLDVEVAIDLHRDLVVQAMRLAPTERLSQERRVFRTLNRLFLAYESGHGIELHFEGRSSTSSASTVRPGDSAI